MTPRARWPWRTKKGTLDSKYVKDTDGDGFITDETPVYVTTTSQRGYYATLAFDPLNRPMVAHYDGPTFDLKFSVLDTGLGWVTTTVDSAGLDRQPLLAWRLIRHR